MMKIAPKSFFIKKAQNMDKRCQQVTISVKIAMVFSKMAPKNPALSLIGDKMYKLLKTNSINGFTLLWQ